MASEPRSYKHPYYARLSRQMEQRYGLPEGLLASVVTKGERSNADQVSEAGAKTVFQIIPATRKAAIEKWGIDPYLSAENAAEVAARLLKDSLERNRGDVSAAVGEYHGGTDRENWGPRTRAYVRRVAGSTFERVKAQREAEEGQQPSIAKVFEAYKAGKLSPEERAQFEQDVISGAILLPRGAELQRKPGAVTLPPGVVQAYNSQSEMTDEERAQLDRDLAEGLVQLPKGSTLRRPAPRTVGEQLGMGARGLMTGAAGLVDIAAGPVGAVMDAAIPGDAIAPDPTRRLAEGLSDTLGLPEPATKSERLANAIIEGGTQGVLSAGTGIAASGARGTSGMVARALAENPITDVVASGAATGAQELAQQSGAGVAGQLAAALAGGIGGVGASKSVEGLVKRFGPKAAKVVETTPRQAVIDEAGELTEEGREVAARAGVTPQQLRQAYDEAKAAANEAPEAPPAAVVAEEAPLPASAATRAQEAASEGVDLTRGQATRDFATQEREQTLAAMDTPEGQQVREHFAKQGEQIKTAVERFREGIEGSNLSTEERGELVKEAVRELRDQGKAGVTALYDEARKMAEGLGEGAQNLIQLDAAPILGRMRELFIDEGIPDNVRRSLKQQAAKYGLIGENPRTVEGETTVQLRDNTGEPGGKVSFIGPPQRLTLLNAEELRKAVNALFEPGKSNPQESLKPLIDDAVDAAVERAASEGVGDVGAAFKKARAAHVEQKQTFSAKDVVQRLIEWKNGTQTDALPAARAIDEVFGSKPDSLANLKRVKSVLLSKPTERSRAAWKAIQAHGVARIFEKALGPNDTISGAKLNSEIKKFGPDKLKVLLEPEQFNQLMKLRRIIGDATIPLPRTTNPSGSGYAVIRFLSHAATNLAPVARMVPLVRDIVQGAQEFAQAKAVKQTAEGVTDFTADAARKADQPAPKKDPIAWARKFLTVAGSDEIITPLMAAAANEDRP